MLRTYTYQRETAAYALFRNRVVGIGDKVQSSLTLLVSMRNSIARYIGMDKHREMKKNPRP